MATQPIDPIEEHIAQAMAAPKFVASLEEISQIPKNTNGNIGTTLQVGFLKDVSKVFTNPP